jgi:hypothetical protein
MTAYGPRGETVAAWDGKLGGGQMGLLQVVLDRPLKIEVEWKVYHRLTVSSPVNSYEGMGPQRHRAPARPAGEETSGQ